MVPKENRLTKDRDFEILFKDGRFAGGNFITTKMWTIDPAKYPLRNYRTSDLKIAFLVSKKVDKRAVVRNRLKRQMREVVRLLLLSNKIKPGCLLAFVAKPEAKIVEYAELEKEIVFLLKRLHLLYE